MKILITGVAGFIGYHLAQNLLNDGRYTIIGCDNINHYYDPQLKQDRLAQLRLNDNFHFIKLDIVDRLGVKNLFDEYAFDKIIHLAGQAGVRYSIENPHSYVDSNLVGFMNVLECARQYEVKHFLYASSSSVYGADCVYPLSEEMNVDHPVSLYAATKKANELMAHSYSSLYGLPTTGLRFFTVYGPWGRPDMALFKFTKAIMSDSPIDVFNNGNMERDFTYVGDLVSVVRNIIETRPGGAKGSNSRSVPYAIYNIGNGQPVRLIDLISIIEKALNKKAIKHFLPMQAGDVVKTFANIKKTEDTFHIKPETNIEVGVKSFIDWYLNYYCLCSNEV